MKELKPVSEENGREQDWSVYVDSDDHVAHYVFGFEHADVTDLEAYEIPNTPYLLVTCTFPHAQRPNFLNAVSALPAYMEYMEKEDYEAVRDNVLDLLVSSLEAHRGNARKNDGYGPCGMFCTG